MNPFSALMFTPSTLQSPFSRHPCQLLCSFLCNFSNIKTFKFSFCLSQEVETVPYPSVQWEHWTKHLKLACGLFLYHSSWFSSSFKRSPGNLFGFPYGAVVKNPPANAGDARDVGLIPGLGRSPGVENGNQLLYSGLKNSMDRRAWHATVLGVQGLRREETWFQCQLWLCSLDCFPTGEG